MTTFFVLGVGAEEVFIGNRPYPLIHLVIRLSCMEPTRLTDKSYDDIVIDHQLVRRL